MATLERLLAGDDAAAAIRVTPEGPVFTRGALRADVKAVSVALARAGVLRGDVVSLCFRNQVRLLAACVSQLWRPLCCRGNASGQRGGHCCGCSLHRLSPPPPPSPRHTTSARPSTRLR